LGFVVVRISLRHAFHGFEIREHAGAMIDFVEVGMERGHRIDEIAASARTRCASEPIETAELIDRGTGLRMTAAAPKVMLKAGHLRYSFQTEISRRW
jgi:hypothetical protein